MRKQRYLVTGASGHLGNVLVRKLARKGKEVRCLFQEKTCPSYLSDLDIDFILQGDISQKESVETLFAGGEDYDLLVLHLASKVSIDSHIQEDLININVQGTKNLLELAKKYKVKRFLYCSSVHAIPEQPNHGLITEVKHFDPAPIVGAYAKTKAMASQLVMEAYHDGLDTVIIHPSGIFGPYDFLKTGLLNQLIYEYAKGKAQTIVEGGYNLVDVRDVAQGILDAVERGRAGEGYILSGQYITIGKLLAELSQLLGVKTNIRYANYHLAKLFVPLIEWWAKIRKRRPLYTSYSLYTLRSNANFSHQKASEELAYKPRPIRDTLADMLEFFGLKQTSAN